jgi:hypothetical protein
MTTVTFNDSIYTHIINNRLEHLPDNIKALNLDKFVLANNNIRLFPQNMNFPNLNPSDWGDDNLSELQKDIKSPNSQSLNCEPNILRQPLETMNYSRSNMMCCTDNTIRHFPLSPIDFSYLHNTTIQQSVKDSINNITSRHDLPKYNLQALITLIMEDPYLNCKEKLIEYCDDNSIHSLLSLTFGEVLWSTLQTIHKDFDMETQKEIKNILNQEMKDAEGKRFTGYMDRVVGCLNGFSPLVRL